MQNGTLLAAVDLGSNSFRLEIGRYDHGTIQRTEYLKETVRQGKGLDAEGYLTPEAMQRGWDCLARFGECLTAFQTGQVRAVATQTLREARNRDEFLQRADKLLGFPIEIIPGREEARLIYLGVAHMLPHSDERRLVLDIGGRSTEIILGQGLDARVMESYPLGSVAWSMKYFPTGQFTARAFAQAMIAAKVVLEEAIDLYAPGAWDVAYGSSGTVGAVSDVLSANGWPTDVITRQGLDWLADRLIKAQTADRLKLEGLKDERRAVVGGGLSVLRAAFDLLGIDQMSPTLGALRHGLMYDLLDREQGQTDPRSSTVKRLAIKFGVDAQQARRVSQVACHLLLSMTPAAALSPEYPQRRLDWAAQLHEIGHCISHSDPHKHGAYILDHADAPGFALQELHWLSLLVLGHRGKLHRLAVNFENREWTQELLCLRLAVLLCHARRDPDLKGVQLQSAGETDKSFALSLRPGWREAFPQSAYLLEEEVMAWQKTPWALKVANR